MVTEVSDLQKNTNLYNHFQKYISCESCKIGSLTTQKVFFRGNFPTDILFVNDAPNSCDDTLGLPCMGIHNKLFSQMLEEAKIPSDAWAIINAVLCTPFSNNKRDKVDLPKAAYIFNCSPKLKETIELLNPKLVIAMGKKSEQALRHVKNCNFHGIYHPSTILGSGGLNSVQGQIYYKKNLMLLKNAFKSIDL